MSLITVGAAGAGGAYDYTCDGADDHAEILAALAAAAGGDTVALSAGTFACAADITVPAGVNLAGTAGTILQFPETYPGYRLIAAGTNTISDLDLWGAVALSVQGSAVTVRRATSRQVYYPLAGFEILPVSGLVDGALFEDCAAVETSGFGFFLNGSASQGCADTATVSNATFRRCTTYKCGNTAHPLGSASARPWVTGFLIEANVSIFAVSGLLVEDCRFDESWETGFYVEPGAVTASNCVVSNCTSYRSGRDKPDVLYGYGFKVVPGFALVDCTSTEDTNGIWTHTNTDAGLDPVRATRCRVINPAQNGFHVGHIWWANRLRDVVYQDCEVRGAMAPYNWLVVEDAEDARILDTRVIGCTGGISESEYVRRTLVTYVPPFTVAPTAPYAGQAVAFADLSYGATSRLWSFGDGETSAAQAPVHAYATPGVYPVTLTVDGISTVPGSVVIRGAVVYGAVELSHPDLAPIDHDPVANATETRHGRVRLQGSPVSRRAWTINALADDRAEIEALAALTGQHLVLNINGVEYPGVMIRPPMLETQLTPSAWAYQIGFVQETRR